MASAMYATRSRSRGPGAVGVDDAEGHVHVRAEVERNRDVLALRVHPDELDARPCGFSANHRPSGPVVNC